MGEAEGLAAEVNFLTLEQVDSVCDPGPARVLMLRHSDAPPPPPDFQAVTRERASYR